MNGFQVLRWVKWPWKTNVTSDVLEDNRQTLDVLEDLLGVNLEHHPACFGGDFGVGKRGWKVFAKLSRCFKRLLTEKSVMVKKKLTKMNSLFSLAMKHGVSIAHKQNKRQRNGTIRETKPEDDTDLSVWYRLWRFHLQVSKRLHKRLAQKRPGLWNSTTGSSATTILPRTRTSLVAKRRWY